MSIINNNHYVWEIKVKCSGDAHIESNNYNDSNTENPCRLETSIKENEIFANYLFSNIVDGKNVNVMEYLYVCPVCGCISVIDSTIIPEITKFQINQIFFDDPMQLYEKISQSKTMHKKR